MTAVAHEHPVHIYEMMARLGIEAEVGVLPRLSLRYERRSGDVKLVDPRKPAEIGLTTRRLRKFCAVFLHERRSLIRIAVRSTRTSSTVSTSARAGLLSNLEKDPLNPARVERVTTLACKVLSTRHNGAANNISQRLR